MRERAKKARGAYEILRSISNAHSGIGPKASRALCTAWIRLMMTYGAEIWHDLESNLWRLLEPFQSLALRRATGAYRGSSVAKVETIANVEP